MLVLFHCKDKRQSQNKAVQSTERDRDRERENKKIPVGAKFSAAVQAGPEVHRDPFQGVKRPGCGVNHPPHLAPRLKKQ